MDKIIIITDFRSVKAGDKFVSHSGGLMTCDDGMKYNLGGRKRYIVAAEIEVPENARCLAWSLRDCNKAIPNQYGTVTLPRKTVKKWLWRFDGFNSVSVTTDKPHSEEEMNLACCTNRDYWRKVEGSEIEE